MNKHGIGHARKWRVGGGVVASTYIGEVEAHTWQEAIEAGYDEADLSLCHECSRKISDPEIDHLWAEDDDGDCTSEETLSDQVSAQRREINKLRDLLNQILGDDGPDLDAYLDGHVEAPNVPALVARVRELTRERDEHRETRAMYAAEAVSLRARLVDAQRERDEARAAYHRLLAE